MSYVYNTRPNLCYYVNLNTYTKGKFGNTDFNPPLSDPIEKNIISYNLSDYNSLSGLKRVLDVNPNDSYQYFGNAYREPNCELCSLKDCNLQK